MSRSWIITAAHCVKVSTTWLSTWGLDHVHQSLSSILSSDLLVNNELKLPYLIIPPCLKGLKPRNLVVRLGEYNSRSSRDGRWGFLTDQREGESWSFKSFSYKSEDVDKKTLTYSLYTGRWTREWRRLFCTADSTGTRTSNNMLVIQITNHDFNNASSTAWFWSIQHVQNMYHIGWGW